MKKFLAIVFLCVFCLNAINANKECDFLYSFVTESDSVDKNNPSVEERRNLILTPKYYTNWLGASFFTIPNLEKDLDIRPIRIIGSTYFYDLGYCFVGMESIDKNVVIQLSFRLFGGDATDFVQKAIDYGYKYVEKGRDIVIRANSGKLLPDIYTSRVKKYRKKTDHGYVYIEVANSKHEANSYEIVIYRRR